MAVEYIDYLKIVTKLGEVLVALVDAAVRSDLRVTDKVMERLKEVDEERKALDRRYEEEG